MEKIAIIGMGIGGMAVAEGYRKEVDPKLFQIDCYDTEESFGRGYPYREDSDELLLNLKTRKISYNYEDNDDLANWHLENNLDIKEYTSRARFGEYTRDRLKNTMDKINANKILEKVIRLDYLVDKHKWELETQSGNIEIYDRVHLCAGELPQADPFNLKESKNYIHSVYPCEDKLKSIKESDPVSIIGMGLTGVDVASYLLERKNIEKLYMFSRTNIIPTVRVEPVDLKINHFSLENCIDIIEKNKGLISFSQVEDLLNKELESHGLDYENFVNKHMIGGIKGLKVNIDDPSDLAKVQAILPPMNLALNKIWVSMTEIDKMKFRDKYHPFMCLNRSPLPLVSANILINAEKEGRLTVLDDVDSIKKTDDSFDIISKNKVLATTKWVCNATGLDISMKTLDRENTLVGSLLNKRYLQVDDYGGISVLPKDMTPLSPRFGNIDNIHLHGVLVSGVQYRNNSTLIIQKTAHDLMKNLY